MLKAAEYSNFGVPVISVGEIQSGYLLISDRTPKVSDSTKKRLPQFVLKAGDIVFGRKGAINRNAIVGEDQAGWFLGSDGIRLRLSDDIDSVFVSYQFRSSAVGKWLLQNSSGSIMPSLNQKILDRLPIWLPNTGEQQKIAAVLSAFDAKIDCNNRINAELEAMAKTLYDYWFVQFDFPDQNGRPYKSSGGKMVYNPTLKREIPAGWEDSSILAVADLLGGGTPTKKKPEYWNGAIPFFTPTDADGSIYKFATADYITEEGLRKSSTKLFGKNTVFITARGSVGKLVLAGVDMAMNQSCYALQAKSGISHTYLFFLTRELIHHLEVKSSGSVFNSIVSNDIEFTKLAIPDTAVVERFAAVVESAFQRIANNTLENQHLTQLRDWLLPMLMNGQVTVE
ncbi:restriction endonuclease subunit S [Geothermobacter hydrogeniphilus]|uniref:Restriction endonuclease subunit S n=2 Tax=Geothermobacter hydrogeniphilus TaxID=1969733 RepID=A0A1X0Y4A5_9BACT|nr:restriction endonuclease subunit S [Geothermobacter hydrogeniphilus]